MMKTRNEIKLLARIKEMNGLMKIVHQYSDDKKRTYAMLKIDGKYYEGMSECSNQDQFDKKIGRVIAIGRAVKEFEKKSQMPLSLIPNELRFNCDREETK